MAAQGDGSGGAGGPVDDRTAIADVIHTYARHIREGNGAACAGLFAADAVYEMFALDPADMSRRLRSRLEGRDAIVAHLAGSSSADRRVVPMIHNLIVTVDGDTAESSCLMTAVTLPAGDDLTGEYRDAFRRDGGAWRFAGRAHTILIHRPAPPRSR